MARKMMFAIVASLAALPVLAQGVNTLSGKYVGSGEGDLTVDLQHLRDDVYKISIETIVPMENDVPGCGGGIDGEVILTSKGGNFFVENEDYEPGSTGRMSERVCEIGLSFADNDTLKLEERNGCLSYHGASCGFTGELKRTLSPR